MHMMCAYMNIWLYLPICMCMHVLCVCMCECVYMHLCTCVHVYVYVCVFLCVCVCMWVYVPACVYTDLCVRAYVHVCIYKEVSERWGETSQPHRSERMLNQTTFAALWGSERRWGQNRGPQVAWRREMSLALFPSCKLFLHFTIFALIVLLVLVVF